MSDFDREAEREKLREKYERDEEKREAAEQMSELLLQGATMTNRHCPACHSPIFRYDGQQFCPSCQREVTEDGEFADEAAEGAVDAATNGEANDAAAETHSDAEPAASEGSASPEEPDDTTEPREPSPSDTSREQSTESADETTPTEEPETRPAPARERSPARIDPPVRRDAPSDERNDSTGQATRRRGRTGADDLREAEAALIREIAALTRQAEETRDVGRKRDLFAAADEAAETLQTIRRV